MKNLFDIHRFIYFVKYFFIFIRSFVFYGWRFSKVGYGCVFRGFINLEYPKCFNFGRGVRILGGARMEAICYRGSVKYNPKIIFGDSVNVGHNFFLTCANKITIGDNVLISDSVAIIDNFHDHLDIPDDIIRSRIHSKPIIIGNNVTIYRCATILGGVTIGQNSIIGAYSLVKSDVPPNCLVVGIPARVVKIIR